MSLIGPGDYKYIVYNSLDGAPMDEISLSNVSFTVGLNGAGSISGEIDLADPKANPILLQTLSREICVFRDGQPQQMGPIIGLEPDGSTKKVRITCATVWWYLSRRSNELRYTPANGTDVATVIWTLISNAQGKAPGGDVRLTQSPQYPAATGQGVSGAVFSNVESNFVSTLVERYATQYPGFDFDINLTLNASSLRVNREFDLYAPFKGVRVDQQIGNQPGVSDVGYTENGAAVIGRVSEMSGTDASNTLIVRRNAAELTAGQYPMVEEIFSREGDLTTLGLYADADLYLHRWPLRVYKASYIPSPALPYGFCRPGDTVQVAADIGNFPVNADKRVASLTVNVSGGEKVTLTFNEPVTA